MKRLLLSGLIFLCLWMPSHSQNESEFVRLNDDVLFLRSEIYIKQGRTMVPAEKLLEALHIEFYIDLEKKYLNAHGERVDVKIPFDVNYAYINDERILLNVSGEVKGNQIYIPLRFVSEAFGADVLWLEEKSQVAINYRPYINWQVLELLETIASNSKEEQILYTVERQKFKEILLKAKQTKESYLKEEVNLVKALKNLGTQVDVNFQENLLKDMMEAFHLHWKGVYERDLGDKPWIYEDDYYFLSFEDGYYYGYYTNYQAHGYRFGYTVFDEGYILSLVPYKENKRQGIAYKLVYNKDHIFLYDMFYKMEKNMGQGLEYVRYSNGVETFDRSDKVDDTLVLIDQNDHVFIPPLNPEAPGLGFYQWADTIEYVGFFQQMDRLGQGMYFGVDEKNFEKDNLLKERSLEIIESLNLGGLSLEVQIKKVHDYLALNIRYDHGTLPKTLSHTAYGALVLGEGVCDGYAESFKYLLDLIGVENQLIFGTANGEAHGWNLVKINGEYFHYDLTWNDDDKGQVPVYTYYNRSSEFFRKTHQWDNNRYNMYLGNQE